MFTTIARRYDLLNHVLSMNVDRSWRRALVRAAQPVPPRQVLDVATGTGDVAIAFARHSDAEEIVGIDPSEGMLEVGREKIARLGLGARVRMQEGDALALPYEDGAFDVVSIAFGLRNLPDFGAGMSEMARVLRPGGRLFVLEFFPPRGGLFLQAYRFYLGRVLPLAGRIISGSPEAYRYLAASIENFVSHEDIRRMMAEAGLVHHDAHRLSGGIAWIHEGERA
jgi:demethylmenaquinone methyltransferase/2-methoxy-6-polyprenyl-1,4-benzoquinol methylase